MTTTLSERDVQVRRAELSAERDQLDQRRPGLALQGDADELGRIKARLAEIDAQLDHQALLAAGLAQERARQEQAAREAAEAAAAERQRAADAEYWQAAAERDEVAIDGLNADLAQLVERIRAARDAGALVDEKRAATGRPSGGAIQRIDTPAAMARHVHSYLARSLDAVVPGLGQAFVFASPSEPAVAPLTRNEKPKTVPLLPDRFPVRNLEISGPHIHTIDAATLPAPFPKGQAS